MKNILIVGASGQVGTQVIKLLKQEKLNIFAASRSEEKRMTLTQGNVKGVYLDLERKDSIRPALQGMDSALLITGYTADMMRQSKRFLDIAKEEGIQHIVHIGASSVPTNEVAHWGWHSFIEAYIEKLGFEFTHIQPESFMQNLFNFGWLQENTVHNFIGNSNWSWVDTDDVAEVIAAIFKNPEKYYGQSIPLGYDAKTIPQIASLMEELTTQKFTVTAHTAEDFFNMAFQGSANSVYADASMRCVADQFAMNAANEIPEGKVYQNFEEITGRKPSTWLDFLKKNLHRIGLQVETA
jgi:uncharacterized protein YbjT (DUF2867 family)